MRSLVVFSVNPVGGRESYSCDPVPRHLLLLLFITCLLCTFGWCQDDVVETPRTISTSSKIIIPRLDHPPQLEDFLSMEPQSETALKMVAVTGFVQRDPHDGAPVSEPTTAYLGYD